MTTAIGSDQIPAPIFRALVIDGVRLRPFPAGQDARVKAWMGTDPHTNTIHVRAGDVPVVDTRNAATPVVQVPRSTRVPGVARPARPLGVDHEVPARKGEPDGRPGPWLPGTRVVDEATVVVVEATTSPSGVASQVRPSSLRGPLLPATPALAQALASRAKVRAQAEPPRPPSASRTATGVLPCFATTIPLRRVGARAARPSACGPTLDLVEELRTRLRLPVATLVDASRPTGDAPNEVAAVPTSSVGLEPGVKAGAPSPTPRRALVVVAVPGLLLRARIRGVPATA